MCVDPYTLHLSTTTLSHASLVVLALLSTPAAPETFVTFVTAVVVIPDKLSASDLLHHQCN